jgi:hypothetical protein
MSDLPCINLFNKQTETHHSESYRILYKIYRNENNQQSTNLQIYIDGKNVKESMIRVKELENVISVWFILNKKQSKGKVAPD